MHIFLTGKIQVGKSTLIRRVLEQISHVRPDGFRTVTVADIPGAVGSVYIVDAGEPASTYSDENRVGVRRGLGLGATAYPDAFDQWGVALLEDAETHPLILMDEIGKMEADAKLFYGRVAELLDGDVPILGVVRQEGETPLQVCIRTHPKVKLITVTEDNRDTLAEEIAESLRWELNKRVDSAGAFVFRDNQGVLEVLMIRGRRGWAFPKGHLEFGETAEDAAIREVREETGVEIALLPGFRASVGSGLVGEQRTITYFLGSVTGGRLSPQPEEVLDAAWVPAEEAVQIIRFPQDVPAYQAAHEAVCEKSSL